MNQPAVRFALIVAVMVCGISSGICQTGMPEVLDKGTLTDQMKFLEEKTRIYEQYRAIREDIFQKIKINSVDSLTRAKEKITGFATLTRNLNSRIDSLNNNLNTTREELKEMTKTKNSISILGIKLDKIAYNTIMWTIMAGLVLVFVIGYLTFRRNHTVTVNTKKELAELRNEFEEYRKKTRLDREKMSMDHFKEIQKLKGG